MTTDKEIINGLDILLEYKALGAKIVGAEPNAGGWISIYALGREDKNPSAAINVGDGDQRGRYVDSASGERSLSLFDAAVLAGQFADWRQAREHYAAKKGVEIRGSKNTKGRALRVDQIVWLKWDQHAAAIWCREFKRGILPSTLLPAGARMGLWPKRAPTPHYVLALPGYLDGPDPAAFVLFRLDGHSFPAVNTNKCKLAERKCHTLAGSLDSWIIARGREHAENASVIWLVEGPTDMLAMAGIVPPDEAVITNTAGAGSSLAGLPLDFFVGKLVRGIGDADEPGFKGMRRKCEVLARVKDARVYQSKLPYQETKNHGKDIRDWINEGNGASKLQDLIERGEIVEPATETTKQDELDDRPVIRIDTEEHRANTEAIAALATDQSIYQRGAQLVHIITEAAKPDAIARQLRTPRIGVVPFPILRDRLTANARFVSIKETKDGEIIQEVHPPGWCVNAVGSYGNWAGIRPLEGIVSHPILRSDGTVLSRNGYDASTGLFLACDIEVSVPDCPTARDVRAAVDLLLSVVADFPFAKPAHRAAWVAAILTALARFAFSGPAPMLLVDANVRGSGKSLLCDLIAIILTFLDMPRMSNSQDDDEMRKRITALALAGDSLVLLDNIDSMLGSASLDAALTGIKWRDRILGKSETVEVPLYITWFATGNNVVLAADTSRRVCWIRLDSPLERPEEREGFAHPDIRRWARDNRGRLLSAALTILRGFCVAGRPVQRLIPWGSFEGWSSLVRSSVVWAGLDDPGATRQELADRADTEAAALRAILSGLQALDPAGQGLYCAEIIDRMTGQYRNTEAAVTLKEAFSQICQTSGGIPNPKSLGRRLQHLSGRIVDGRAIDSKIRHKTRAWYVREATEGGFDGFTGFCASPPSREGSETHASASTNTIVDSEPSKPPLTPKTPLSQVWCRFSNGRVEKLQNGHLPVGARWWSRDCENWQAAEEFVSEDIQ